MDRVADEQVASSGSASDREQERRKDQSCAIHVQILLKREIATGALGNMGS
jgi:hypothetical protein